MNLTTFSSPSCGSSRLLEVSPHFGTVLCLFVALVGGAFACNGSGSPRGGRGLIGSPEFCQNDDECPRGEVCERSREVCVPREGRADAVSPRPDGSETRPSDSGPGEGEPSDVAPSDVLDARDEGRDGTDDVEPTDDGGDLDGVDDPRRDGTDDTGSRRDAGGDGDVGGTCNYRRNTRGVCTDGELVGRGDAANCRPPGSYESPTDDESCDDLDNDCDGTVDEGCECTYDPGEANNIDLDSSNDAGVCRGQTIGADGRCSLPRQYAVNESSCADGLDNDCDGLTDCFDPDCQGAAGPSGGNCPASDAFEPNGEMTCDGIDNDADGTVDEGCDDDGDGYCDGSMTFTGSSPECNTGGDCDDTDADTNPGAAPEESTQGCYRDVDGDGWGDDSPPSGIDAGSDCDDDDPKISPGAAANEKASGCFKDADGDDWGDANPPSGIDRGSDCDDGNASVNPGVSETCSDSIDNDCNGGVDCLDGACLNESACNKLAAGRSCRRDDQCRSNACDANTCAHRLFVTSRTYGWILDGAPGADKKCNKIAQQEGLLGTWKAVIGNPRAKKGPKSRLDIRGAVYNTNGRRLAAGRSELWSGSLANAPRYDEAGTRKNSCEVWTGASDDGSFSGPGCNNWSFGISVNERGRIGDCTRTNGEWLNRSGRPPRCTKGERRLYCIDGQ